MSNHSLSRAKRALPFGVLAIVLAGAATALAQGGHSGHGSHGGHAGHSSPATAESPATKAYRAANDKMHADMNIAFSGDADVDFVRGMIPHHQGAIDMARVVLAHGKNAETRKLAQEIISAQEKEIAWMRDWLQRNAK